MKIKVKWQYLRDQLTNDRGIWKIISEKNKKIVYKINKTEDVLRRRPHLSIYKKGENKEYLNLSTYQERIREARSLKKIMNKSNSFLAEPKNNEG